MKKMLLALTMFGLVGCHTMADLRAQKPEASFTSNKTVDEISQCVLFGWQEMTTRYGDVTIQPYHSGKTVMVGIIEFADITNNGKISEVKYYYQTDLFQSRIDSRLDVIKRCR